jgi:hypothetical protein
LIRDELCLRGKNRERVIDSALVDLFASKVGSQPTDTFYIPPETLLQDFETCAHPLLEPGDVHEPDQGR